jgi:hypothetical protein
LKFFLRDLDAKVRREGILVYMKSVKKMGSRVRNFATSENLIVKSTFPHRNIHKHTLTYPDGVTHSRIDVLIDKRRLSAILNIRSVRGADCNTDHYLAVAKLGERISVSKRTGQRFD